MNFILVWLLNAVGVYLTGRIVRGVHVKTFAAAALAALVLGVINVLFWNVLVLLTLPLTVLTLGLFYFFLVGVVFWVAGLIVPGFEVDGIFDGLLGSIVLGLINWGMGMLVHHPISWW